MVDHDIYLQRASQLIAARDLLRSDKDYPSATALLAVHTAIALNDAVLIKLTGRRAKQSDHGKSADETLVACRSRHLDVRGLRHLRSLLAKKTEISYGEVATTAELADSLALSSERFQEWAYAIIARIRRTV